MDYKGHKLFLQNKDGKFEEFTFEMAIDTISGQTQVIDELQKELEYYKQNYERILNQFHKMKIEFEKHEPYFQGIDFINYLKTLEGADDNETSSN